MLSCSAPELVLGPNSVLTNPGRNQLCRGDVEGRIPNLHTVEASEKFPGRPLLYRNIPATGTAAVQSRHRHPDIERNTGEEEEHCDVCELRTYL